MSPELSLPHVCRVSRYRSQPWRFCALLTMLLQTANLAALALTRTRRHWGSAHARPLRRAAMRVWYRTCVQPGGVPARHERVPVAGRHEHALVARGLVLKRLCGKAPATQRLYLQRVKPACAALAWRMRGICVGLPTHAACALLTHATHSERPACKTMGVCAANTTSRASSR